MIDLLMFIQFVTQWFNSWTKHRQAVAEKRRRQDVRRRILTEIIRRRQLLRVQRRAGRRRSCWAYATHSSFWERTVQGWDDHRFQKKFRLDRATFQDLCDQLRPLLHRQDTKLRLAITVEKRVAIALYVLKGNSDLGTIGDIFGVGKSTVGAILHEFCAAVNTRMYESTVVFPKTRAERDHIANGFWEKFQFPNCIGAIDGTHFPILTPVHYPIDYWNYKSYHSVIALCVVDSNCKFTYTNIGRPGRMNDAAVFAESGLYTYMRGIEFENGEDFHLIGDGAFPLLEWMMVPFRQVFNMALDLFNYNYRLSRARMVVENAFGRLKGRWRIVLKRADFKLSNMKEIIKTCIVLHNICEENHQVFHPIWADKAQALQESFPQPNGIMNERRVHANAVVDKRNHMVHRLFNDKITIAAQ